MPSSFAVRLSALALVGALAATAACGGHSSPPDDPKAEHARFDFTLKDPAGKDVQLSSFKGRPMIVNFWATYCGPCKAEIPLLNDLAAEHQSQHLAVVGISYDDQPADVTKFLQETPMHYQVLVGLGHDDLMDAYEAQVALPTTWVVRANGTVVAKNVGPQTREWFETQLKAAF
jgi:thiol-disulfide isomerase/thioredoxin